MTFLGRALGKLPPVLDPRTLRLSKYLGDLPSPPPLQDWDRALPFFTATYANDRIGDCAIASCASMIMTWTANNGAMHVPEFLSVVRAYSDVSGYEPESPGFPTSNPSDVGCDMLAVLKHWRSNGIASHKVRGFVKLDHDNVDQIKTAIRLFGGVYVGASLPMSARTDAPWMRRAGKGDDAIGSWGGHAMALSAYDRSGVYFRTWGRRQSASWSWFLDFCDEAYVVLSDDWRGKLTGLAPNGLDLSALERDLQSFSR